MNKWWLVMLPVMGMALLLAGCQAPQRGAAADDADLIKGYITLEKVKDKYLVAPRIVLHKAGTAPAVDQVYKFPALSVGNDEWGECKLEDGAGGTGLQIDRQEVTLKVENQPGYYFKINIRPIEGGRVLIVGVVVMCRYDNGKLETQVYPWALSCGARNGDIECFVQKRQ